MAFLKAHPYSTPLVTIALSFLIRFIGITSGIPYSLLLADALFVVGFILLVVGLWISRKDRGKPKGNPESIGHCETCGKPYTTDREQTDHALSHR